MSVGNLGDSDNGQDVELNLAPIIDSFVVLISFMLVSAAFLSIGIMDAGISAGGASATSNEPPPISITVFLEPSNSLRLQVTGKDKIEAALASKDGSYDLEGLVARLQGLKTKWAGVQALTLQASDKVEYQDVIKAMDKIKATHPAVLLGGF